MAIPEVSGKRKGLAAKLPVEWGTGYLHIRTMHLNPETKGASRRAVMPIRLGRISSQLQTTGLMPVNGNDEMRDNEIRLTAKSVLE